MINFPNEESQWIWLAGIIDCDATISLSKVKAKTRSGIGWKPVVQFNQTSETFIKGIQETVGYGQVIKVNYAKPRKCQWVYVVTANPIRWVLPKIVPFLLKKKEQAILLLEALDLIKQHRSCHTHNIARLEEIYKKLRSLHEKGCAKFGRY